MNNNSNQNKVERINIKQWAIDDRPREKMIQKGPSALSDAELIAILIGSGNRNETAVDLAKRILLSAHHNLSELAKLTLSELQAFNGMGEAKSIHILAALELGKRRKESDRRSMPIIRSSRDVFEHIASRLIDLSHEEFWVLHLNRSNKIIRDVCISRGGITGTVADLRLIFKSALESLATSIVVCHNHPSGNPQPSPADLDLTLKIKNAGELLDIHLVDHIIVTEKKYFSFADEGKC
ncbi:MAG: DNA repair protein RadC [Candidatus Competibacteraceae bacterium]|nr:DNA repair protein RadC [Candidatus Competibacteraceae bacterium]